MKKFAIQAILLVILIAGALYLFKTGANLSSLPFLPQSPVFKQLEINNTKLFVEIADTEAKRSKGLGDKQSLNPDEGMLFIFSSVSKYPFWMKGLTFPLDFVWVEGDKVVDLTPNVQSPTPGQTDTTLPIYQSKEDIDKVLEISAGTIQRLNIKVGDTIKIL